MKQTAAFVPVQNRNIMQGMAMTLWPRMRICIAPICSTQNVSCALSCLSSLRGVCSGHCSSLPPLPPAAGTALTTCCQICPGPPHEAHKLSPREHCHAKDEKCGDCNSKSTCIGLAAIEDIQVSISNISLHWVRSMQQAPTQKHSPKQYTCTEARTYQKLPPLPLHRRTGGRCSCCLGPGK